MSKILGTYDPQRVIVVVGPAIISGFEDGTFIEAERTTDLFSKKTGVDGLTVRSKSADKSGTITLTLQQTSPSNAVLSTYYNLDEQSSNGAVPIVIKDLSGTMMVAAGMAWARKHPKIDRDKVDKPVVWVFDCANLIPFEGGST